MVYCSIIAKDEQESAMTDKRETQRISREAVADQLRRCRELRALLERRGPLLANIQTYGCPNVRV